MKRKMLTLGLVGLGMLAALLLATLLLTPSQPADARAVTAANELYAAGHYAEAASIYEEFVADGVEDATLFYNLGNAYFQQGDLGRAILNYQRAAQLDPRDADIQANLALAREQVVDPLPDAGSDPAAIVASTTSWLTLNEAALLALALWFGLGFLILAARQINASKKQRWLRTSAVIVGMLLLMVSLSLGSRMLQQRTQPSGVVVVPTVAVNQGPGESYPSAYSLTNGTEVNLVRTQGNWAELALPDGAGQGWVPLQSIAPLAPFEPVEKSV